MARHAAWAAILICAAALVGCGKGEGPAPGLEGNGGDITGVVTKVLDDGGLLTNIPFQWIAAESGDKGPSDWDKRQPSEGWELKITVGGTEHKGTFACWRGGFLSDSPWAAHSYHGHDRESVLVIDFSKGNAAKVSGASVGTRVRLVKVGHPH